MSWVGCAWTWVIDHATVLAGTVGAFATAWIAVFTCALKRSTDRLWKASREALETTERAFVFIDGFDYELTTLEDGNVDTELAELRKSIDPQLWITRFAAQPRWKNGGNSPTKNMTIRVDWSPPDEDLPVDFIYRNHGEPFFLAPRATEPSGIIEMPGANASVNNGFGGNTSIIIWGRADYEDVFGHQHFVQWCYRVRFERHDRKKLRAHFIQWGAYNRTDEDHNP